MSIVIPVFDEEVAIGQVVSGVMATMAATPYDWDVVVVDDGSSDGTAAVLAGCDGIRVIRNVENKGYGFSLRRGIESTKSEYIVTLDGDGTYPVEEIPALLRELDRGFDLVVGARTGKLYWGSGLKSPARQMFRIVAEYVAGTRIPDINSGFRAFRRKILEPHVANFPSGFSFSTTMTLMFTLSQHFVKYIPVSYHERKGSASKVKPFKDTLRTLQLLASVIVRYNPLKLFLLIAMPFFALTLICFILWLFSPAEVWILGTIISLSSASLIMAIGFAAEMWRVQM